MGGRVRAVLAGLLVVPLAGVLVALTGCAPTPAPEPFGELSFSRTGGVAGFREVLRVRPDGVAVLVGRASGRLSDERLARLRTLATSPELRAEAERVSRARTARTCSDTITTGFTMGSLSLALEEPCGRAGNPPTPTLDAVGALLADGLRGRFDEPLRSGDVPSLTVSTRQSGGGRGPYTVAVDPDGSATLSRPGASPERRTLPTGARDAIALTADGLLASAASPCPTTSWTVTVVAADGRTVTGSGCAFGARGADAAELHLALARAFDLL